MFAGRRAIWAFALGCVAVTAGVILHLPMFLMAKAMNYQLAGAAMDGGMLWGMALIVGGVLVAGYGLLPRSPDGSGPSPRVVISPPEDAPLGRAHWSLMAVLVVALIIDTMKPASLGFVVPGMRAEYHVTKAIVAWLPFSALTGTAAGSFVWGLLADLYGRRAAILLSAVMFVGTSICGAMPSFGWNVLMCFMMGVAAGGMLPVAYALLSETMPTRHRNWSLVLVGGLGMAGGYLAASGLSGLLQPLFGWRIMWFLNLPTGLIMILLNRFLPESPRFLMHRGHVEAASRAMLRFGCVSRPLAPDDADDGIHAGLVDHLPIPLPQKAFAGQTAALTLAALAWGLVNFGILLWLPAELAARGYSAEATGKLLSLSALIALPTAFAAAALYSLWSSKWALVAAIAVTGLGLVALIGARPGASVFVGQVLPVALLIIGSNALLAMLLPYAAETYPLRIRARATGWVAGCSKLGGLAAQVISLAGVVVALGVAAISVCIPVVLALMAVAAFGAETRGRDLREIG